MELYIKQKVFSFGDKFSVKDRDGYDRYFVQGEVFSFGKKLHVYDLSGREIAFIQQKIFSLLPKYFVNINGVQAAEIIKEFTFFRNEYTVSGPGWKVHGNFADHSYQIYDANGRQIAYVAKQWLSWGDTYEISVSPDADELMALSVCLVIDACLEAQDDD